MTLLHIMMSSGKEKETWEKSICFTKLSEHYIQFQYLSGAVSTCRQSNAQLRVRLGQCNSSYGCLVVVLCASVFKYNVVHSSARSATYIHVQV